MIAIADYGMGNRRSVEKALEHVGAQSIITTDVKDASAIILPGVRIGSRAVVGAGSVVTRDVPDAVFAAGNPCQVVRSLEL